MTYHAPVVMSTAAPSAPATTDRGRSHKPSVSVVVPVFNSEQSLPHLVARLFPVLETHAGDYELILVDDQSRDGSWEVIQELCREHSWVHGISLMRNFGQHAALLCGIRAARFDVVITMDDDLQHPPEEVPKLLGAIRDGFDVVYGRPHAQRQGIWRDFASWIVKLSLRAAMGITIARDVSAFRAFRTELRSAFAGYRSPYVIIDVLLTWGTSRFGAVEVEHHARPFGRSNYTPARLISHAVNMTTGFSAVPLRLASFIGVLTCIFGAFVLAYVVARFFLDGGSPPGFPFLASIIVIFSGAQLLALGIIGEYLARLHFRSMERPAYVVAHRTGAGLTISSEAE
jgi:undecaprenyl-phosphate 4-deoxy-4-formamido-L-arabinose transferase